MRKELDLGIPPWVALKLLAPEPAGLQQFRIIGSVSLAVMAVTGIIISCICRGLCELFPLSVTLHREKVGAHLPALLWLLSDLGQT